MLHCRSFVGRLVVLNEHSLEVIPRVDDTRLETCEPIHCSGLEHNYQVICHDIRVATVGLHSDGITHQPLLRIGVAIIRLDSIDLQVGGPLYGVEPRLESLRTISDDGVINDSLWSSGSCSSWGDNTSSRSGLPHSRSYSCWRRISPSWHELWFLSMQ